jgi:hypothetical protein
MLVVIHPHATQVQYVRSGTLRVRAPWLHVAPVPDRNTDDVEAGVLDLPKVLEGSKGLPMGSQGVGACLLANLLAE